MVWLLPFRARATVTGYPARHLLADIAALSMARLTRYGQPITRERTRALTPTDPSEILSTGLAPMRRWRWLILLSIYLALLIGGWFLGRELFQLVGFNADPPSAARVNTLIATALGAYVVTSATPFVPGAEIGLSLILLFGASIALFVYCGMVLALLISFLVGRFLPPSLVARCFGYFGLSRARDLVVRLAPLRGKARLDLLTAEAPRRLVPFMLRHRYLTLILLFNLPGNSVIGGGGGIALTAGLSGLYSFPAYLGAVLIAVAPVPIAFLAYTYFM